MDSLLTNTIQMTDTLPLTDTLQTGVQGAQTTLEASSSSVWMWVAIIEFIVLLLLVCYAVKTRASVTPKRTKKQEILAQEVDFDNVMQSAFKAQQLYDSLKKKYHPDRFATDPVRNKKALELFQAISKAKNDYKELLALQKRAEQELKTE